MCVCVYDRETKLCVHVTLVLEQGNECSLTRFLMLALCNKPLLKMLTAGDEDVLQIFMDIDNISRE